LLEENGGYLKTADVLEAGVSRSALGDFVRKNELERVAHGLYMSKDAWEDVFFVIQVRYPDAVFSHETALYLLKSATREPSPISVTLRTGSNSKALLEQGIRVYTLKESLFREGVVEVVSPFGHKVNTYNMERTLCDLFRSRRNIEIQELQAAVKEYVRSKEKNIPQFLRYAKALSVETIVRQYLEVLL